MGNRGGKHREEVSSPYFSSAADYGLNLFLGEDPAVRFVILEKKNQRFNEFDNMVVLFCTVKSTNYYLCYCMYSSVF